MRRYRRIDRDCAGRWTSTGPRPSTVHRLPGPCGPLRVRQAEISSAVSASREWTDGMIHYWQRGKFYVLRKVWAWGSPPLLAYSRKELAAGVGFEATTLW